MFASISRKIVFVTAIATISTGCTKTEVVTPPQEYDHIIFVSNGDGSFTDTLTGKVWEEKIVDLPLTLVDAVDYCETLELAGRSDWILPTESEFDELRKSNEQHCTLTPQEDIPDYTRDSPQVSLIDDNADGVFQVCNSPIPSNLEAPPLTDLGAPVAVWAQPSDDLFYALTYEGGFSAGGGSAHVMFGLVRCVADGNGKSATELGLIKIEIENDTLPAMSPVTIKASSGSAIPMNSSTRRVYVAYSVLGAEGFEYDLLTIVSIDESSTTVMLPAVDGGTQLQMYVFANEYDDIEHVEGKALILSNNVVFNVTTGDPIYPPSEIDDNVYGTWIRQDRVAEGTFDPAIDPGELIVMPSTLTWGDIEYPGTQCTNGGYSIHAQSGQIWTDIYGQNCISLSEETNTSNSKEYHFDYSLDPTIPSLLWISNEMSAQFESPTGTGIPYCAEGADC